MLLVFAAVQSGEKMAASWTKQLFNEGVYPFNILQSFNGDPQAFQVFVHI